MDYASANGFTSLFDSHHLSLHFCQELSLGVCSAKSGYIPQQDFKDAFVQMSSSIEQHNITSLVFDKKNLRTFHQPTMEWYMTKWKPEMRKLGLCNHYKILPELSWFVESVNAGKHEILQRHGDAFLSGIAINYLPDVADVIELVASEKASRELQSNANLKVS